MQERSKVEKKKLFKLHFACNSHQGEPFTNESLCCRLVSMWLYISLKTFNHFKNGFCTSERVNLNMSYSLMHRHRKT